MRDGVVVDDDVLTVLCAVGDRLAEVFDEPQDVEWVLDHHRLTVVEMEEVR